MRTTTPLSAVVALIAGSLVTAAGCERQDPVQVYKAPKEAKAQPLLASAAGSPKSAADEHEFDNAVSELAWTAPSEWTDAPLVAFSAATYAVPGGLSATVSPIVRGPGAVISGSVLPNVNRWQGQLGLPPSAEAELDNVARHVHVNDLEAMTLDLTGTNGKRMLAAIVPAAGKVYFFKLMGDADKVAAQAANFEAWVKTIRPAGAAAQPKAEAPKVEPPKAEAPKVEAPKPEAPKAPAADAVKIPGIAAYTLPAGWQVDATPRPMRAATIIVTKDGATAQIIVSRLGAGAFGDKLSNLNRWRGQVGLPPTENADAHPARELKIAQGPVDVLDFEGPAGAERKRQLVAVTKLPDAKSTFFFRFLGPHELIGKSSGDFDAFVKSLKIEE